MTEKPKKVVGRRRVQGAPARAGHEVVFDQTTTIVVSGEEDTRLSLTLPDDIREGDTVQVSVQVERPKGGR